MRQKFVLVVAIQRGIVHVSLKTLVLTEMSYTAIEHVCCICSHRFFSETKKDAKHVVNAIKVNRDGPYCELCRQLEMAARIATMRGYDGVRKAMTAWKRHNLK